MQITPRTATVSLHWRPTPRAYDARTVLLNSLEEQKRLRAFQLVDETGRALLDDDTELVIGVNSFSVAFASGFPEGAALPSLLDSVLDIVKPRVSRLTVRFQHLLALPMVSEYEQAKAHAAKAALGSLTARLKVTDSAVLFDGLWGDGSIGYQAEFGIVDKSEATARLTQAMGRLNSADEPEFTHVSWNDKDLPGIALYVDSRWRNEKALSSTTSGALYSCAKDYAEHASEVVQALFEIVGGELPER